MAEFEGAGERYKFLLQPVKDLAANWDLDIAKTLEEYIRKVIYNRLIFIGEEWENSIPKLINSKDWRRERIKRKIEDKE